MSEDARKLISETVLALLEQVPALKPLKLVVGFDLHGRGDTQQFRLELPQAVTTKDIAADAKLRVDMRRDEFNRLAAEPTVAAWRKAIETGRVKVTGIDQYLKLIAQVVDRQHERTHIKRARG